jgi:tellurite resistance protein
MESNFFYGHALTPRALALEETYFRQLEKESRRRLRLRRELGAELEIEQASFLDRLIDLGVTPDTAPAFEALPLVELAWADGGVDRDERWQTLQVATAFGLELGSPAHAQLELWLTRRPPQELFEAWCTFAAIALAKPGAAHRARRVREGALEVAAVTGGILGSGISRSERAVIEHIDRLLGSDPEPPRFTNLARRAP